MIFFSSDLHFNHQREFIYNPRGFETIKDMNETIITRFNIMVEPEDDLYLLGDNFLGQDLDAGLALMLELPGKLHLIRGNHDSDKRWEALKALPNVVEIADAKFLKYGKYHFFLSHFPTMTGNLEKESLSQMTLNLSGHTHSKDKFYMDMPYIYNVAVDAHDCYPISAETILMDMKNKMTECKEYL